MSTEPGKPDLVTSPQAAHILGVSNRTVHRLADAGELKPALQLPGPNGAFLFLRSAVEALRDARAAAAAQPEPEPNGATQVA